MRERRRERGALLLPAVAALVLVCALAQAASASPNALRGRWAGRTSQRDRVQLRVVGHRVVALRITADIRAESCDVQISLAGTRLGVQISAADTFRVKMAHGPSSAVVRGEFTSDRRARGTFAAAYRGSCGRGRAEGTWRATRR